MTAVITVPKSLDDQSFEQVLEQLAQHPADDKVIVDARHCTWSSPYGLTALLALAQSRAEKPAFMPPSDADVSSYWARAGFFRYAEELFAVQGSVPHARKAGESDVLLEVTPVNAVADVHGAVERIQEQTLKILTNKLRLQARETMGFTLAISESCQNIIEHAGRGGWVMVQCYQYRKRLGGRFVAVLAVCDSGIGFRRSLESSNRHVASDRWSDGMALETAIIQNISRHLEKGRGQGLKGIRQYVDRRDGKLTVRSGTARVAMVPKWDDDIPRRDNLAEFPGAQLQVIIPEALSPTL